MSEDLLRLAEKQRRRIEATDSAELENIVAAYANTADTLAGDIDSLSRDLAVEDGESMRESDIIGLGSFQRFKRHLRAELDRFESWLSVQIPLLAVAMITAGQKDADALIIAGLLQAGLPSTKIKALSTDALANLMSFLDRDGPLFARLKLYGETNAEKIAQLIIEAFTRGKNPRDIAAYILGDGLGMGLTDALRMVRTVQLWSYREATRATYIQNSDVVNGWVWYSALIPGRTCMSCVNMHGSVHKLDEVLNDHHNGLCTMLPLIGANPVKVGGLEWFLNQPQAVQLQMMGPGKLEAWKAGDISFGQLSTVHNDDVYGPMRVEASLKSMLAGSNNGR